MSRINPHDYDRVLDVSRYQLAIDALSIKNSGIVGVYAKACEWFWWNSDPKYKDPYWDENARKISDAGMYLGAYEYYRSKDRKPKEQAEWFREVAGDHPIDFVVIDVEKKEIASVWQFTEDLIEHTKEVQGLFGVVPWIYTRKTFWDYAVGPALQYDWYKHPLIAAHYNFYMSRPWVPTAWSKEGEREVLWQITDKWVNPGVQGGVDLNLVTNPDQFYNLMGKPLPPSLEERVADLQRRVAQLEEYHS
jgi:GH25 family lysozyme M1 (1,4-beta-N-acetylmuramidase)